MQYEATWFSFKGHIQATNDEICASKKIAYMILYFIFLLVQISSYLA